MTKSHLALQALVEGAIMVALAQLLGYLKLYSMPFGGSVTLAMLPLFLYCTRWGFGKGILAAFAFSCLQFLLDGGFAISWQSILGDYVLAYTVIGAAGLFHNVRGGFFLGTAVGCVLRWIVLLVTGATVWAEYMPEKFLGRAMTSPWIYSAIYNGIYVGLCAALCLIVGAALYKPLGKYLRAEALQARKNGVK